MDETRSFESITNFTLEESMNNFIMQLKNALKSFDNSFVVYRRLLWNEASHSDDSMPTLFLFKRQSTQSDFQDHHVLVTQQILLKTDRPTCTYFSETFFSLGTLDGSPFEKKTGKLDRVSLSRCIDLNVNLTVNQRCRFLKLIGGPNSNHGQCLLDTSYIIYITMT